MNQKNRVGDRSADIKTFLGEMFGGDLHAKRVESLANGTLGVMTSACLAVSVIGQALAQARGLLTKHAITQVDRLLSHQGIVVWDLLAYWVLEGVGQRRAIVVAMDWTDYDADGPATLVLSLVTAHGRATPLIWLSVHKDELMDTRHDDEGACLARLAAVLPAGTKVTILADRGFADVKLFAFLDELGFGYVIRLRGNIQVTAADGEKRPAAAWVGAGGRARKLRDARVTAELHPVAAVICVHAKTMKEPWCLVTSKAEASAREILNLYAKRWTIEPSFRDTKDLRFGMGLETVRLADPDRRDRLLLLNAFAIVLLTLLGAAGESLGMDRYLKVNTVTRRTPSLFRQGCMLDDLIPNMPDVRLRPRIERFAEMLQQKRVFSETFSII